ncbi:MAG: calcium-binding protein [Gammaproteobacteria bacterium]|nr:calcium-binding protein [Gammaproteobacteria bacterium]
MSNHEMNGFAPEDGDGFFSSLSGEIIELEVLSLVISLEFTSGNSVVLDRDGTVNTGSYTYEKTGPNAATLVLTLDNDDEYTVELEYESATRLTASIEVLGQVVSVTFDLPDAATFTVTSGDDTVDGLDSDDVINALAGNDTVNGNAGADTLNGDEGNDILNGGAGADIINGGPGDDTLDGGPGADMLDGGPGSDTASYQNSAVAVLVRLHNAAAVKFGDAEGDTLTGIEHLIGSPYNDVLAGDGEDNIMKGEDGDDVLYGGPAGGDDMMYGGNGDDRIFGGRGNDILTGGEGNDRLRGGPGEDTLIADGDHMDVLHGGPDDDIFRFFPSDIGGGTIQDFTDGEDVIDLTEFTDINSMDDLDIVSRGDNVRIEVSGTDYLTTIILSDFDMSNLDNSDFMF